MTTTPGEELLGFWPPSDADHVAQCFFTEAETADEAVFLAVHQPMTLWKKSYTDDNSQPVLQAEADLREAFLEKNPLSGTLILPVVGESGVGKSHLIRWLYAELKQRDDAESRHLVRIPKSASLRRVLELILEGLSDSKYDAVREKLRHAVPDLSLREATNRLDSGLTTGLQNTFDDVSKKTEGITKNDRAKRAHCAADKLQALLREAETQEFLTAHEGEDEEKWGVLTRIAHRFITGARKHDHGEKNEFFPEDFAFLDLLEEEKLSDVTKIYVSQLKSRGPEKIAEVVSILNGIVESARANLLTSGISLSEIFLDIRRELLADKKELVLLIEDFAVLGGIQGPMYDAMITEAIRDGTQVLCTMRTALAVTEGRISEETVRTRARSFWKIESQPYQSEADALEDYQNFVGGFLNAARCGATALRTAFDSREPDAEPRAWIPHFCKETRADLSNESQLMLGAFGTSPRHGYSLFPLNPGAIRQLARRDLRKNDDYRFRPRKLIGALRDIIRDHRDSFQTRTFPPANFLDYRGQLSPEVRQQIGTAPPGSPHDRIAVAYYFWGDNPRSRGHAVDAVPNEILTAFQLPRVPDWDAEPVKPKQPLKIPEPNETNEFSSDMVVKWESWRTEQQLNQRTASSYRNALYESIEAWIDRSSHLLHKQEPLLDANQIWLPFCNRGNPEFDKAVVITGEESALLKDQDLQSQFFLGMRAVARFFEKKSWNYPDGEIDSAHYANLIENLAGQVIHRLRKHGTNRSVPRASLVPIAEALAVNARILGLPGASDHTNESILGALLEPGPEPPAIAPQSSKNEWEKFRDEAITTREDLRNILFRQISARQGDGEKVQAVDATVLLKAAENLRKNQWQVSYENDVTLDNSASARSQLSRLKNRLPAIVEKSIAKLSQWLTTVTEALGEEFRWEDEVKTEFRETLTLAKATHSYRNQHCKLEELRSQISQLDQSVDETARHIREVCESGKNFGQQLTALAQIDFSIPDRFLSMIENFRQFLNETESLLQNDGAPARSLKQTRDEILAGFTKLETDFSAMRILLTNQKTSAIL